MKNTIKKIVKKMPLVFKLYRQFKHQSLNKIPYIKEINGKGNKLNLNISSLFIECKFDIIGNNNEILIDNSTLFNKVTFYIRGNYNKIRIANNVIFSRGGALWIEDENCEIRIGEHTTFEDVHIAVTEPNSKINIGKDCMFAYDIDIRTGDSHSIIDLISKKRINYAKNVEIEDHVWIASHVSILKGSKIMQNSVVATRSVVTIPFNEGGVLIGGTPAKILKENITWDKKRIYNNQG